MHGLACQNLANHIPVANALNRRLRAINLHSYCAVWTFALMTNSYFKL